MSVFEVTARHNMYLGPANQIDKGERFKLNIHTMGVQPYNIFSNPYSRRQAIQQFSVNGIDVKNREYLLNNGHWDVKRITNEGFSKAMDINVPPERDSTSIEKFSRQYIVDDVQMKKDCISLVKVFYDEGMDLEYMERGLQGRCEIASNFYDVVKKNLGIDSDLCFVKKAPGNLGGYNPCTNQIELNSTYLESPDCEGLLNTILHESRHAFQNKCIKNPESVTVKNNIIDVWKDNFENYIKPEFDFEAYENQEIEKDANYFADSVIKKGKNAFYV